MLIKGNLNLIIVQSWTCTVSKIIASTLTCNFFLSAMSARMKKDIFISFDYSQPQHYITAMLLNIFQTYLGWPIRFSVIFSPHNVSNRKLVYKKIEN